MQIMFFIITYLFCFISYRFSGSVMHKRLGLMKNQVIICLSKPVGKKWFIGLGRNLVAEDFSVICPHYLCVFRQFSLCFFVFFLAVGGFFVPLFWPQIIRLICMAKWKDWLPRAAQGHNIRPFTHSIIPILHADQLLQLLMVHPNLNRNHFSGWSFRLMIPSPVFQFHYQIDQLICWSNFDQTLFLPSHLYPYNFGSGNM